MYEVPVVPLSAAIHEASGFEISNQFSDLPWHAVQPLFLSLPKTLPPNCPYIIMAPFGRIVEGVLRSVCGKIFWRAGKCPKAAEFDQRGAMFLAVLHRSRPPPAGLPGLERWAVG
jgi:hypothetical protein